VTDTADERREDIHVDIVSGEPLFTTTDTYDPGTGWPSFTRLLDAEHIVEKTDPTLFMTPTEVHSRFGDSDTASVTHLWERRPSAR